MKVEGASEVDSEFDLLCLEEGFLSHLTNVVIGVSDAVLQVSQTEGWNKGRTPPTFRHSLFVSYVLYVGGVSRR